MPKQFKLTIVSLRCISPSQPGKSETVRLSIVPEGYCAYSGTRSMNNGVSWQLNKTFILRENGTAHIEGVINATQMPILMFPIPAQQQPLTEKTFKARDNTPYYKLKYKVETDATEIKASTSSKTFGNTTRYVHSDGWGGLQLYLNSSDIPGRPYMGKYHQVDEKDGAGKVLANHCGPTAGKNLAYWYGTSNMSYTRVGQLMKTNNYAADPEIIAISSLFIPIAGVIVLNIIKPGGTLPKYMNSFLCRPDMRPNNLSVKWRTAGNSPYRSRFGLEYEVRSKLKSGHPVAALIYTQNGFLHWLLITGFFRENGKWMVRLANYGPCVWKDFCDMWHLSKLDSVVRDILTWVHIHPYVRLYF